MCRALPWLFLLGFRAVICCRVAIVGGGIGGAATSFFLRNQLPRRCLNDLRIEVFEESADVGGRIRSMSASGRRAEVGAGVVHSSNRYFSSFVETLNLTLEELKSTHVVLWDGVSVIASSHLTKTPRNAMAKILDWLCLAIPFAWKHGTRVRAMKHNVALVIQDWEKVYDLAEAGVFVNSSQRLMGLLGVAGPLTQVDASALLALPRGAVSYTDKHDFMAEVVAPVNRLNYGQSASMHAFASAVSLAGLATIGSVHRVKEGNDAVVRGLLGRYADAVHTSTRVLTAHSVNAIESAASAVEVSAVGARNVAGLVRQFLDSIDVHVDHEMRIGHDEKKP
eukprot:Polyplicarium_translucidae@DN1592_c0_g1_i2.p1